MAGIVIGRGVVILSALALPVLSAGCSGVTYGTGTRTEVQLFNDVTSIVTLGGKDQPDIDYKPRGGVVVPPPGATAAALPPPADPSVTNPSWPKDPGVAAKVRKTKQEEEAAAVDASTAARRDPGFRLPKGTTDSAAKPSEADAFQRLAAAKAARGAAGSVDANGNPVRRYLTEPPVEYRKPDPGAPEAPPPEEKKGWFGKFLPGQGGSPIATSVDASRQDLP